MFRPMRRKQKELPTEEARRILREARYGVLAVAGDDGYPYAVPLNYLYDEARQTIIFHSAAAGHKVDALKRCDKVCFTVCGAETVKTESWAPYVQSAVVFGRCHPVTDRAEVQRLVRLFARKYYPSEAEIDAVMATSGQAVQVYEIAIEHVSGKKIQEK